MLLRRRALIQQTRVLFVLTPTQAMLLIVQELELMLLRQTPQLTPQNVPATFPLINVVGSLRHLSRETLGVPMSYHGDLLTLRGCPVRIPLGSVRADICKDFGVVVAGDSLLETYSKVNQDE